MKSYSNNLSPTDKIENRLTQRIDKLEKKITYAFIGGVLLGAASIGFDVFSIVKFVL